MAAAWFVAVLALLLAGLWLCAGVVAVTLAVARWHEARRMRRAYAAGVVAVTPRTTPSLPARAESAASARPRAETGGLRAR